MRLGEGFSRIKPIEVKMSGNTLILSCGIFRKELKKIIEENGWNFDVVFLQPLLHLDSKKLNEELNKKLERFSGRYDRKIVVYGKCSPEIDEICFKYGAKRIRGEHCPEILLGERFWELMEEESGTYYLTPPLCKNFERMVIKGTFIDDYPRLKEIYFRNYKRVVYIDTGIEDLSERAREISKYLNLEFMIERPGVENLATRLKEIL
jgi:Protein of unknown function (DUF1638).